MLLKSVLTYFRQNGNLFQSQEINKIALNISIILFQIFPRFQTHFLPGDTIRCISGGITGNKEKSVILQDFFFSQIISCFFFPSCSPLLLLLFRNSCFFFWRFLMFFCHKCFYYNSILNVSQDTFFITLFTLFYNFITFL